MAMREEKEIGNPFLKKKIYIYSIYIVCIYVYVYIMYILYIYAHICTYSSTWHNNLYICFNLYTV